MAHLKTQLEEALENARDWIAGPVGNLKRNDVLDAICRELAAARRRQATVPTVPAFREVSPRTIDRVVQAMKDAHRARGEFVELARALRKFEQLACVKEPLRLEFRLLRGRDHFERVYAAELNAGDTVRWNAATETVYFDTKSGGGPVVIPTAEGTILPPAFNPAVAGERAAWDEYKTWKRSSEVGDLRAWVVVVTFNHDVEAKDRMVAGVADQGSRTRARAQAIFDIAAKSQRQAELMATVLAVRTFPAMEDFLDARAELREEAERKAKLPDAAPFPEGWERIACQLCQHEVVLQREVLEQWRSGERVIYCPNNRRSLVDSGQLGVHAILAPSKEREPELHDPVGDEVEDDL